MTVQCTACTPISSVSDWKVYGRKLTWRLSANELSTPQIMRKEDVIKDSTGISFVQTNIDSGPFTGHRFKVLIGWPTSDI